MRDTSLNHIQCSFLFHSLILFFNLVKSDTCNGTVLLSHVSLLNDIFNPARPDTSPNQTVWLSRFSMLNSIFDLDSPEKPCNMTVLLSHFLLNFAI